MSNGAPDVKDEKKMNSGNSALQKGQEELRDDSPRRLSLEERERMRRILGVDPGGDIRLHVGERADKAAQAMGAQAFTLGSQDIYFREGAYAPGSLEGERLLAHELTHVLESAVGYKDGPPPASSEREKSEQRADRAEDVASRVAAEMGDVSLSAADKEKLISKVVALIERGLKRDRERRGR